RRGADVAEVEARLAADKLHQIKAVLVIHNETSTSCVTHPLDVRKALNRTNHPALLMVDTISGLASLEYEHDAWGIDVSVGGSQKGMMLPPGLSFNAISEKALAAAKTNTSLRSYWDWHDMIEINKHSTFPYTPPPHHPHPPHEDTPELGDEGGGGGARQRVPAPQAPRCGDPRRGQGLGPRTRLPRPARLFAGADRGDGA